MHIGRKFRSKFFYVSFFINEITASDAGPDIIRSHLFNKVFLVTLSFTYLLNEVLPAYTRKTYGKIIKLHRREDNRPFRQRKWAHNT